jgi:hypothetical protein
MLQRHPTARAPPWGRRSCGQPPRPARPPPCRRATTPALPPHVVELAAAAAEPVAKVALLTSVGALCSRAGVLRAEGRRLISTLLLNVFTPALLFSKLGASVGECSRSRLHHHRTACTAWLLLCMHTHSPLTTSPRHKCTQHPGAARLHDICIIPTVPPLTHQQCPHMHPPDLLPHPWLLCTYRAC